MARLDKGKSKQELLFDFRPPKLNLDLAIGHKHGAWYLVFAHTYRLADSREVARLDKRGLSNRKEVLGHPCFCFDPEAVSGWERQGQSLLDLLLAVERYPILKVVAPSSNSMPGTLTEVEVIVPEAQLAHCCECCEAWESTESNVRWILVRHSKLPGYLCPDVSIFGIRYQLTPSSSAMTEIGGHEG